MSYLTFPNIKITDNSKSDLALSIGLAQGQVTCHNNSVFLDIFVINSEQFYIHLK